MQTHTDTYFYLKLMHTYSNL